MQILGLFRMIIPAAPASRERAGGKRLWNRPFCHLFGEEAWGLLQGMDYLHFLTVNNPGRVKLILLLLMMWHLSLAAMWWNDWVMMNVCLCSVCAVEQGACTLAADSVFSCVWLQGDCRKQGCLPVPYKLLRDAFPHQYGVDKLFVFMWLKQKEQMRPKPEKSWDKNVLFHWELLFLHQCYFCFKGALDWLWLCEFLNGWTEIFPWVPEFIWACNSPSHKCFVFLWFFWSSAKTEPMGCLAWS